MGVLCEGIHGAHNCLTSGKARSGKSGRTCLASLWDLRITYQANCQSYIIKIDIPRNARIHKETPMCSSRKYGVV